jgi:hypothetical protein
MPIMFYNGMSVPSSLFECVCVCVCVHVILIRRVLAAVMSADDALGSLPHGNWTARCIFKCPWCGG